MVRANLMGTAWFLVYGLLFTFVSHAAQARPLDAITDAQMDARLQSFAYTPWNGVVTEVVEDDDEDCVRTLAHIDVQDPVSGTSRSIQLGIRRPKTKKKLPIS